MANLFLARLAKKINKSINQTSGQYWLKPLLFYGVVAYHTCFMYFKLYLLFRIYHITRIFGIFFINHY